VIFSGQAIEFAKCGKPDGRIHITWMVDHPRYLFPRMQHYAQIDHVYVGCVDRKHVDFLKRYYGIENAFFAPHFAWKAEKEIPYQRRKCEVFFPASHVRWQEDVAYRYPGLVGALRTISENVITFLLEHVECSLEEGMEAVLRRYGETDDTLELSKECIEAAGEYIDSYVRIYVRDKVVRSLINDGITVTVCGRNWNEFAKNDMEREHLHVLGAELPYEQVLEIMADSKIVLNVMPWFKDGSHERIAAGCINGAVCVTDSSIYLRETWGETGLVYYDWKKTDVLSDQIRELLENPAKAETIAREGQRIAEEMASVKVYAERIQKCIEHVCE
jgi:hypothetical protein